MRLDDLTPFVACALCLSAPSPGAEAYFEETFRESVESPNIEGEEFFKLWAGGGGIHRLSSSGTSDRRYIRTLVTNYNRLDFLYEITFLMATDEIVFAGIGQAAPSSNFNEPLFSLNLRIHSPDVADGKVEILGVIIGNLKTRGPHRVRFAKRGNSMTYALDADFNGSFAADMSYAVSDLAAVAPFLKDFGSRLFFGNSEVATTYVDLVIAPNPDAARLDAADFDDNGEVNIADPIGLLSYLFLGTSGPPPPSGECGFDPDQDELNCGESPTCR